MTKTKPTKHGLVANAGIEPIKREFPVISYADLCELTELVPAESGGHDIPFHPEIEFAGSVAVEVSGGTKIPRQQSEFAGSVVVEVSDGTETPRQQSEFVGSVAVEVSGGTEIPCQQSGFVGSVAVEVSGGTEIPRQQSEVMEVATVTLVPIDEMVRNIRLETNYSSLETKIHRFPRGLQRIGGQDKRYISPGVVALGPYYHGLLQLQEMEEEKRAAAHYLCVRSGRSVDEVYGKILSIVAEARSCYADTTVAHFSDEDFATMMFFDGCFLLRYITENMEDVECAPLENRMTLPAGPCMLRDIFLLENQLPWLVLEALAVTFSYDSVHQFVAGMAKSFDITARPKTESCVNQSYKPPHLLGLLRHHLIGSLPTEEFSSDGIHSSLASSAIELAEIGIKLTASNKTWFANTSIQKGLLFGKLSLTPLFLSDYTACWLVNMAVFEACMPTSTLSDGYTICSYLSLLAMLMDKVEDVHVLRAKHLLHGDFTNQEMLDFFKGLAQHLPHGQRYKAILKKIEEYKCQRTLRIVVHKFIYNNYKTIPVLFSIGGVLASIFFGCMSLKHHR